MVAITITALSDPVAIVHIPIHLADTVSSKMYWTVDSAPGLSKEFFNVTSNAVEIAVFARTDLINHYWAEMADGEIKISSNWRVFEISSGDQGETNNYDSPHLRHVSAPLSRAGISILFQTSYFTDFLLVKESTFKRASEIFAEQGWHVDSSTPSIRRRSQLLSPITPISRSSPSPIPLPPTPILTVLPSPLVCVGFSHSIERTTAERVRQLVVWPEMARDSWKRKRTSSASAASDDRGRPFISYTRTVDGGSIVTETRILRWMFGRKNHDRLGGDPGSEDEVTGYESAMEGTEFQLGGQLAAGYVTDTTDLEDTEDDEEGEESSTAVDVDGTGGYEPSNGSSNGNGNGLRHPGPGNIALASLRGISADSSDGSTAEPHTPPLDEDKRTKHYSLPTTPRDHGASGVIPQSIAITWCNDSKGRRSTSSPKSKTSDRRRSWQKGEGSRRSRGSETDEEADELLRNGHAGVRAKTREKAGRKRCLQLDLRGLEDDDEAEVARYRYRDGNTSPLSTESSRNGDTSAQRFHSSHHVSDVYHMDKCGVVTTFTDLLNTRHIRMLYSSTFHTANILVEARDVHRARRLLQGQTPAHGQAREQEGGQASTGVKNGERMGEAVVVDGRSDSGYF